MGGAVGGEVARASWHEFVNGLGMSQTLYFKGSAAAADPLVGQVPPGGRYDPLGRYFGGSKLGSLGVFKTWDL